MSEIDNKLVNSAHMLGVMLGIPMYVDPEKGFESEKVLAWENGDQVKINVVWSDGAFYYTAHLGQIDPKTGEMSFISGEIANGNSPEAIIGAVDFYLKDKAVERGDMETAADTEVTVPEEQPEAVLGSEDLSGDVQEIVPDAEIEPEIDADELVSDYRDQYEKYTDLLLDPDHDRAAVGEMSRKLAALEVKLRENGISPVYLEK